MHKNELSALDILSVFGFFLGLMNYVENVDQNTMQDTIQKAVNEIHKHLDEQDTKMDLIISMLGGENNA